MEKLLISLWFGTLTMSNHLHKGLPFKGGHNDDGNGNRLFKQWLISNGAGAELCDILCKNGISNMLSIYNIIYDCITNQSTNIDHKQ